MQDYIAARCVMIARYIIDTGATVREAARHFTLSKSGVHKDMDCRLKYIHEGLYNEVRDILQYHKSVRHLRGGQATREKYCAAKGKKQEMRIARRSII
ncbi:MAG: sporulation transcriptional regulator SpoIIID [Eubacteriales bacterium]|nr:sporulation transcriptional regulator SpoIIID [Eubacteriales bacterium]MDD3882456.1 sporulation transcriptional regulator SpoIIID [Eubacteriales bacterium]MDD4513178.1 sporulation transcriptional regulator SpoIIID [Eubacteriales bacterium]